MKKQFKIYWIETVTLEGYNNPAIVLEEVNVDYLFNDPHLPTAFDTIEEAEVLCEKILKEVNHGHSLTIIPQYHHVEE